MTDYKKYIAEVINNTVEQKTKIDVIRPPKEDMGDFSVASFSLEVEGINNPAEKARAIADKLVVDKDYIEEVSTIGPYINFKLNKEKMAAETVKIILKEKNQYGMTNFGQGQPLLLEHTSINPNASPHIGRARNSIIGDFLARLYKFVGYEVTTHYFINDIGKQIAMLVVAVEELEDVSQLAFDDMLKLYVEVNEKSLVDPKIEEKVFNYLHKLEQGDPKVREQFKKITDLATDGQKKIFAKMDIKFDVFTHESDFVYGEVIKDILAKIEAKGRLKEDELGRLYVDLSGYDIPTKTPVLILTREDKTSLYPLRDIAYTLYKLKLNDKNNFIVLGEDQETYMKQISAILDILGYPAPKLISYSFVLLNGDKMATREGKVVLLEELLETTKNKLLEGFKERKTDISTDKLEDLAAACIKFNMLNVNRKKNVNFNVEEATNFQGESAIYLLYNYVRINSIIKKADNYNQEFEVVFNHELEYSIINDLYDFNDIIKDIVNNNEAVVLTKYLYGLTQKFSKYYSMVSILNEEDDKLRNSRLLLLESIQIVLGNGLEILGIKTIQKM